VHPAIRDAVNHLHAEVVHNVQAASLSNAVLVVGMAGNPFCKRARKSLDAAAVPYHYLEYGSYVSRWRERLALKMWTGWPTFPMVFVKGSLVGGADDVARLIASGELRRLLACARGDRHVELCRPVARAALALVSPGGAECHRAPSHPRCAAGGVRARAALRLPRR
jgi:glutaredoxin-related protein